MNVNLQQLITYISMLGLGSLLGIFINNILGARTEKRKMLFDARIKAYSGITGRMFNLFLEPDITSLPNELVFARLNQLLSETLLTASYELAQLIGEYKPKVFQFHVALSEKNNEKSSALHKELVVLAGKIHNQMRKDIFVCGKSLYDNIN